MCLKTSLSYDTWPSGSMSTSMFWNLKLTLLIKQWTCSKSVRWRFITSNNFIPYNSLMDPNGGYEAPQVLQDDFHKNRKVPTHYQRNTQNKDAQHKVILHFSLLKPSAFIIGWILGPWQMQSRPLAGNWGLGLWTIVHRGHTQCTHNSPRSDMFEAISHSKFSKWHSYSKSCHDHPVAMWWETRGGYHGGCPKILFPNLAILSKKTFLAKLPPCPPASAL